MQQIEIFQIDTDNLRCGWCQAWLDSTGWVGHANQHFTMLEQLREESRLTITVSPKPEEDYDYDHCVEDL